VCFKIIFFGCWSHSNFFAALQSPTGSNCVSWPHAQGASITT
jgi:hypothetical protein